ncbi:helix-turn-helix domain-containing protein [Oscillospiraceae bacterium PP1C4]
MYSVYIVDDEPLSIQETIQSIPWMDNGMQVIGSHTNPQTAIWEIMDKKPDVVICDLKMPVLDGNQLMLDLKQKGLKSVFIMLSAHDTFQDSRTFFRHSGFDYLLKPIDPEETQLVLERLTKKLSEIVTSPVFSENANSGSQHAFKSLEAYIRANYQHKITLEILGKKFGLSPGYICNLFAARYNRTLTSLLTELRMKDAAAQLLHTDKMMKQISISCGYGNYIYFCRVFKDYYGVTPTEYRECNV